MNILNVYYTFSESESESSANSSPPAVKKTAQGRKNTQKHSSTSASASKSDSKDQGNSESENEKPVARKLTRSSNTRKSKHLTGKVGLNSAKTSDPSESENDSKRSLSKSPVKKAKNSKLNSKANSSVAKKTSPIVEERKCPVEGCDSKNHLAGFLPTHFTQEACPLYHNMTANDTKAYRDERLKHEEERKNAIIMFEPKKPLSVEQKAYQIKIDDLRTNFKPNPPSPNRHPPHANNLAAHHPELKREPKLNGYVPDYDLRLFREAQALASEKLETDLLKLPPERGTKLVYPVRLGRFFAFNFNHLIW